MMIDSAGFRWLNETWLKVDRGVSFYNTAAIPLDTGFLISRAVFIGLGFLAVSLSGRHFTRRLRGAVSRRTRRRAISAPEPDPLPVAVKPAAPLGSLGMTTARPGLLAGAWHVARNRADRAALEPGALSVHSVDLAADGWHGAHRSGLSRHIAADHAGSVSPCGTMGTLITCLCLLLLFYTVETLERERSTRLAAIAFATPIRSGSFLLGKSIALAVVAVAVVVALAVAGLIALGIQQKVGVRVLAVLALLGAVAGSLDSGVDRLCDPGPDDHTEPIHHVCARAAATVLHGLSPVDRPDQLGGQLAALECGASERHQHAGAGSNCHRSEPRARAGRDGALRWR